jgi:hypothetical protein
MATPKSGTFLGKILSTTRSHQARANLGAWMSRCVARVLCALFALTPSPARSEPSSPQAPGSAACDRESTAIGRTACLLGGALSGQADATLVVAARAVGEPGVAPPASVTQRLAALVASKLGSAARPSGRPLALADALHAADAARGLIYLSVSLYRDRLEVSADEFTGAGHFWQRVRSPGLRLKSHAFAKSALDPELRALFPAIPLVVTRVDKASVSEHDILALACGDVQGDGSSEIAALGRRAILVGHLERGRFVARASLNWADFSAIAASPLREPIATCTLTEPGRLWVGLSDRADALELSGTLHVERTWHGIMPWPGGGCTRRTALGYEGRAEACPGKSPLLAADFAGPVDAFASRSLASLDGQIHTLRVARPLGSDRARALDSLRAEVTLPSVGAQLAIGDLDEDGLPEVVSSSPTLLRSADELVVRSVTDNGQLRERLRIPVPTGIDALAICPGDGRSMAPLVLATGDGIWVIR